MCTGRVRAGSALGSAGLRRSQGRKWHHPRGGRVGALQAEVSGYELGQAGSRGVRVAEVNGMGWRDTQRPE